MREILVDARFDRSVRCIVITGAGRGFCAGMDVSGAGNPDREPPPEDGSVDIEGYRLNFRHETETYIALKRMEVPIVAMVNGPCVGAGFDLASHCDLAVGSTAARYQVAYVRRGLYADLGGFWSLPKILGWRKAMELMMTGRFMSAEEAHEAGFTNYLVAPDELEEKTMELALELEAGPPIAQKLGKMLAVRTAPSGLRQRDAVVGVRDSAGRHVPGFGRRNAGVPRETRKRLRGALTPRWWWSPAPGLAADSARYRGDACRRPWRACASPLGTGRTGCRGGNC